jgi:aspartyl protease family protein
MSGNPGPWERPDPSPTPAPQGRRLSLWLLIVGALGGLVLALARAFPEANLTGEDWAYVAYATVFLLAAAAGLTRLRRDALKRHLRDVAIWAVIVAALALGAAYRHELSDVPGRLNMAFGGGAPVALGEHELAVGQDASGAYVVVGAVNGQRVRFIVDTGATETVLSPDDARRVGAPMTTLRYTDAAQTANGVGYSAAYMADRLEVGSIRFDDFDVAVNQAPMSHSLLGMTFLNRLESFEFRGGKLILRWRGTGG